MRMIARIIRIIADFVDRQDIDFNRFCRMAEEEDNEFIRDRVYELLPSDWVKLEAPAKVKAAFSALPVPGIEG